MPINCYHVLFVPDTLTLRNISDGHRLYLSWEFHPPAVLAGQPNAVKRSRLMYHYTLCLSSPSFGCHPKVKVFYSSVACHVSTTTEGTYLIYWIFSFQSSMGIKNPLTFHAEKVRGVHLNFIITLNI